MKLTAEFLQNVSAKFRDFLKEFWIFEVCNIKSIKISDILWNSGKNPSKSRRKITDFKRFQQNFAKNLENSLNFCKFLVKKSAIFETWAVRRNDNLVDLEKCWKNEYLVAKIGVDTAENEPSKVSGGSEFHPAVSHTDPTQLRSASWFSRSRGPRACCVPKLVHNVNSESRIHTRWVLSCCSTTTFCCCCNYQNFASKFAKFDRIFFRFCKFLKILQIFIDYLWFLAIPTKFRKNLDEKSPIWDDFSNILQKSQKITEILQNFAENL